MIKLCNLMVKKTYLLGTITLSTLCLILVMPLQFYILVYTIDKEKILAFGRLQLMAPTSLKRPTASALTSLVKLRRNQIQHNGSSFGAFVSLQEYVPFFGVQPTTVYLQETIYPSVVSLVQKLVYLVIFWLNLICTYSLFVIKQRLAGTSLA
jgi:hypothetical protein